MLRAVSQAERNVEVIGLLAEKQVTHVAAVDEQLSGQGCALQELQQKGEHNLLVCWDALHEPTREKRTMCDADTLLTCAPSISVRAYTIAVAKWAAASSPHLPSAGPNVLCAHSRGPGSHQSKAARTLLPKA